MKRKITSKRIISYVMVLAFLFTLVGIPMPVTVKAEAADISNYAVLVGNFVSANNLGDDWDPANKNLMMIQLSPNIYTKTIDFTKTGSYEYKAAMNGTWDTNYGQDGANKPIIIGNAGVVQFVLDVKAGKIYDSINDPGYFKATATLTGSLDSNDNGGQSWNPADSSYDLAYIGNGYFKGSFFLKQGTYEYKLAYNYSWSNGEVSSNVGIEVDADKEVTFIGNPWINYCSDTQNDSSLSIKPSLIGTVRLGDDDWTPDKTGYEFNNYKKGKYLYAKYLPQGSYGYKVIKDYKWSNGEIPSNNKVVEITDEQGAYVLFIYDASQNGVYDSINDSEELAGLLGLITESKSPVINPNGTITFNYKDDSATSVSLRGSMNNWGETPMVKEADGVWTITLRLGDSAANYEYKYFINNSEWILDPLNSNTSNGNSLVAFPEYKGRKVVIAGTIQSVIGESNWNPASDLTAMDYEGNGVYKYTFNDVPAGNYEYKVAMGSWDPENYGLDGVPYGPNIPLKVPSAQDVVFEYNDDTHRIVDSINHEIIEAYLTGAPLTEDIRLVDVGYMGVYKATLELDEGTYGDLKIMIPAENKVIDVPEINVDKKKLVTISFDPVTESVTNDAGSEKININNIIYNSRDEQYKKPFGAVKQNESTTFTIKTGNDVTEAKLVILAPDGKEILYMEKASGDDCSLFSVEKAFDSIGTYSYYFILSNGSDVVVYGDDNNADLGLGKAGALGTVRYYTVNVYVEDFKTPGWFKNAVIYQIFPDRFFNGDTNNDYLQKLARGYDPYEFYEDWYSIPENIRLEAENLDEYIENGGTVGDRIYTNEMYGGDIAGIKEKLDYLQALGVNVLYINPISESVSNHRYDTTNYKDLDRLLGSPEEFKELVLELDKRDMHIVIDGVFNHVSDDSIYFDRYGKYMAPGKPLGAYKYWEFVYDLVNEGTSQAEAEQSAVDHFANMGITDLHYKDWFNVYNEWDTTDVDGATLPEEKQHYRYEDWWGYDSMPVIKSLDGSELNLTTWKDEILKDSSQYWLDQGTGGYRLDVANEMSDETWQYFRDIVKADGDNVIIGEIWTDASRYLLGDMYDSVMNYRYRNALLSYLRDGVSSKEVMNQLEIIREQYPEEAFEAMLNLIDSHDTERILSALDGIVKDRNDAVLAPQPTERARRLQKLVPLLQMTYPGAPTIYYGDELGMIGAKDPDDRRAMAWGKGDESTLMAYAAYGNIRNSYSVLQSGDIAPVYTENNDVLAYERYDETGNAALIVVNRGADQLDALEVNVDHITDGTVLTDAISGIEYIVADNKINISIPGESGAVLVTGYQQLRVDNELLKAGYDPAYAVLEREVPPYTAEIIDNISKPENNGAELIVSSRVEEILKPVFSAAVQNNVKPVIGRGNISFVINNPSEVENAISKSGTTGIIINAGNDPEKAAAWKDLTNKLKNVEYMVYSLNCSLPDGILQGDITVRINSDIKKPKLYVYQINQDGAFKEIEETEYKDGILVFNISQFKDFILAAVPIPQLKAKLAYTSI
ncbi:MAG: pullulanase X25 domain-containing protein [Clostridia bacterium]